MQLAKLGINLPDHLNAKEKVDFLQDVILYLHDQLEETESVPAQRSFGFIGTTGAIAIAWSICGLGMVAPVIAIPGTIIVVGCSLLTGATLAKDVIESPELVDLQKRLVTILESKDVEQWAKLWEEVGTESFLKRLGYSCMGGFTGKSGAFRHKSGQHPFDVAALFGGGKQVAPWEKEVQVKVQPLQETPTFTDPHTPAPSQIAPTVLQNETRIQPTQADSIAASEIVDGIVDSIIRTINSLAFIGGQRCGKSWLMAIGSQQGLICGKFKGVCLISAMSIPGEDDNYWQHCVNQYHVDLSRATERERHYIEFMKVIRYYNREASKPNPLLLIIDEYAYLGESLDVDIKAKMQSAIDLQYAITSLISALSSGGAKTGRYIWIGTPKGKIGSMGELGRFMTSLRPVFCAIKEGCTVDSNGTTAIWDESLFRDTSRNFPSLRKPAGEEKYDLGDRIVFFDAGWQNQTSLGWVELQTSQLAVPEQPPITDTHSADEQDEVAAMVSALTNTRYTNLWEFLRDEVGAEDVEQIKEASLAIAQMLLEKELVLLQQKFRIQHECDIRYSYPGYSKKVAATHRHTGNLCCCCLEKPSQEAHHTRYRGIEDEPGKNLLPVCLDCHKSLCHSRENWIQGEPWESHSTPDWEAKLQAGFEMLAQQRK